MGTNFQLDGLRVRRSCGEKEKKRKMDREQTRKLDAPNRTENVLKMAKDVVAE